MTATDKPTVAKLPLCVSMNDQNDFRISDADGVFIMNICAYAPAVPLSRDTLAASKHDARLQARRQEFNRFCELMRSFTNQISGEVIRQPLQDAIASLELINAE